MYIDTHAHLNFKAFNNDWLEAIKRANAADIGAIINVGSNLATSRKAIEIANQEKNVYATIGLHPIHVKSEIFDNDLASLVKDKKVVAIGETGLDYYYDRSTKGLQKEVFEKHLNLAMANSLPIILHCRDASEDVLAILMTQRTEMRGVMHCFAGDWPMAQVVLEMGFYLSFTGLITFSKNEKTFEVIKNMPLERLLLETDCPYMSPDLYRGKRNEPAYVVEIAKKIAELKKIPLNIVASQTTKNAEELFKI